ncbi:hypothetical protein V2J09_016943 [Rumex salicifolius]
MLKDKYPDLVINTDVALDPYSFDGHDGIVREDVECEKPCFERDTDPYYRAMDSRIKAENEAEKCIFKLSPWELQPGIQNQLSI